MSTYVISDIHGMYKEFIAMLELIKFNKEDELYIIGDIIDRGPQPIDLLEYIVAHNNIHLIKGNHEEMLLEWYYYGNYYWISNNGGDTTYRQLQDYQMHSNINYLDAVVQYINRLPLYKILEINEKKYILVHSALDILDDIKDMSVEELIRIQDKNYMLWNREHIENVKTFKDYTIIHGHTPVQLIDKNNTGTIITKQGNIYIDCGACFTNGKLGCLRLDDMETFYI